MSVSHVMQEPPHPGTVVLHECMEPLGLGVTETAAKLGVSRSQLSAVVNGRSGISAEMAIRLSKAFGGSAAMWVRLQANYNLSQAMERVDEIQVERLWPESPAAEPVSAVTAPLRLAGGESRFPAGITACGETHVSAEAGQFSRWGRGTRLTRRVREEYRVYFDRNATMSGAKRRGSAGMDRRSNAA